jgi:hypothetical protein
MSLNLIRCAVRPIMLAILAMMIGPLALATGILETIFPGAGLRFAAGFSAYLTALPDAFWAFAAAAYGFYTAARSFERSRAIAPDGPIEEGSIP